MAIAWKYVRQLKSGRLEFRRAFPKKVRTYLGRQELIVSLEGHSLTDPRATRRYHAALATYEQLQRQAQKAISRSFDELDSPRIAWIVASYEASLLAADDASRIAGTSDPDSHNAANDAFRDLLEVGDAHRICEMFGDDARTIGAQQGWTFDGSSEAFSRLCLEMLRAATRATIQSLERDRGDPIPTPIAPEPPARSHPVAPPKSSPTFDSIVKEEIGRPTFAGGPSTKQSWNTALRYVREIHGALAPQEITRRHVSQLVDVLALAPAKRSIKTAERGWSLPKLVEAYEGRDIERLSWKTRATMVGALQAAWNRCQRSGTIDPDLLNPFARPNLGRAPQPRKNEGLTRDEACAIFALPVFAAGDRPAGGRGQACYWLPALLLATGARPEELAQALVSDVRHERDTGEWLLTITSQGSHPHKLQRALKTPSAERTIPLPSIVVDLGFADYLAWLTDAGELALFPALRTKGARGELWPSFGNWWGGYLADHGARPIGKRPAREFRPTWATIARECGVSREAQIYLMGHAPDANDMNARYGSREPLSREMQKLSFDGWGLETIQRWLPPSSDRLCRLSDNSRVPTPPRPGNLPY